MNNSENIPLHRLTERLTSGFMIKNISEDSVKAYAHRDEYYVFGVVEEGVAEVEIDFTTKAVSAGEAIVVCPYQVHRPVAGNEGVKGWMLALAPEYISEPDSEIIESSVLNNGLLRLLPAVFDDLKTLAGMIPRYSSNRAVVPLVEAVKSMILFSADKREGPVSRYQAIVLRFKRLLDKNIASVKNPSQYAAMLNMSEVYLNEAVKAVTGLNVSRYIRGAIALCAKRAFFYTSLSAQEVAYQLGYSDYAYFSRLFKKETGVSPTEWRKNLR